MENIPTGKVTFLFTDIEGSTKLAQEFADTLPEALEKHNSILSDAVNSNGGYIFEIVGDAFCCSFQKAEDAMKAAVIAQQNLSKENWKDAVIKIRIGIHTGNADWSSSGYMGYITLARTARIMSCAYGEQILISNDSYLCLQQSLPKDYVFLDLGERRLKDLIQPIKLFQLTAGGLREEFPPLKTLDARPNNLPVQLNNFIGREKEKEEIKSYLSDSSLLTLLGAGGTGKTRLSLQVGADLIDRFENGVWITELASISDPQHVTAEIASVFKLSSEGKKDNTELIRNYLREKELLMILDNCEHLVTECAKISEQLLTTCSKLKILASSREAFHISGEKIYKIPSLSLPDKKDIYTVESLSQYESVQLFVERANAVNHDFKLTESNMHAVVQLCHELDGIPLAIELAAARVRVLQVEKILERLSDRFKLLTGGKRTSLPRQQTLKALIDWSYDLLSEKEKILFQKVTVFSGGWTLEAAESVCSDDQLDEFEILDLLSNLIDKSLIKISESGDEMRYGMLETIKKYGEEKLNESGGIPALRTKQIAFFYELVKNSENELTGSNQRKCLKEIDTEYENIREVLKWSMENNPDSALKISLALGKFWELRSYFSEGYGNLSKALELSATSDESLKAKAKYWMGLYMTFLGKYRDAKKYLDECLNIFRKLNYKEYIANTLLALISMTIYSGEYETTEKSANDSLSLSRETGNKSLIASCLRFLGVSKMHQGRHDEARKLYEESLSIYRELDDQVQLAKIIGNIGALEYLAGNYEKAVEYMTESLNHRYELGDRHGVALSLSNLGSAYSMMYEFDKSEEALYKSLEMLKEIGDRRIYATPLNTLGNIANEKKEHIRAISLYNESLAITYEIGEKFYFCKAIEGLAVSFIGMDDYKRGCKFSAMYIKMMLNLNINVTQKERERFEEVKNTLRSNLSKDDYEKYYSDGESMTMEEAMELARE